MFTGISGISTFGNAMNVIGDNIANVNTVGFKGSSAQFANLLSTSMTTSGANTLQIGHGVFMSGVQTSFSQGSFQTTGNSTDMAVQGNGFFVVKDPSVGTDFYTRDGRFTQDKSGNLVNAAGQIVQGYNQINKTGTVTDINVSAMQSSPPIQSTNFTLGANLDSTQKIVAAAVAPALIPAATPTYSTTFDLFDAQGNRVTMTANFWNTGVPAGVTAPGVNTDWAYQLVPPAGNTITGDVGTLEFNGSGTLVGVNSGAALNTTNPTLTITPPGSSPTPIPLKWNVFDVNGNPNITNYSSPSGTVSLAQDGTTSGSLKGLAVDAQGILSGVYTNGQTRSLFQLQLASFANDYSLNRVGGSLYAQTAASGQPVNGVAGSGGLGTVIGNSLELSNVDLASEFVTMVQTQRAYEANSKIITTSDQMMQTVVNIIR
jgi:flagellar hook protein FlgE